jgi:hypothetical protein
MGTWRMAVTSDADHGHGVPWFRAAARDVLEDSYMRCRGGQQGPESDAGSEHPSAHKHGYANLPIKVKFRGPSSESSRELGLAQPMPPVT